MRRILIPMACLTLLFASSAFAGSATSLLFLDGTTVNILEDSDFESIVDLFDSNGERLGNPASEPTLDIGDRLFGMYEVSNVRPDPKLGRPNNFPTTNAFTAVFYVVVTDKSGNATDGYSWTFGAVDQASWTALGFAGVQSASTIAIVYDDSVKDDAPNWIDEDHPGGVAASLATVNGVRLWEVGFGGIQAGEYWEAVGPSDFLLDYADGPGSDGVSQDELKFGANLNITHDYLTSGVTLLPHDYLERSRGLHTWQIQGNGEALDPGNFQLGTDTNLYIVATPEPASLALLGLGLAAFGGVLYRRRRKV
jgi:hypothetical protein